MSDAGDDARPRARTLVEASALALLVLLGTWLQRRGPAGVQSSWLAFLALLLGPAFRRALVLRGRASPAAPGTFALELAGFAAAWVQPVAWWGLALEGAAALASSGSLARQPVTAGAPRELAAARPLERAVPALLLGLALVALVGRDPERLHAGTRAGLALLALASTFAFAPGAARSVGACLRRASLAAAVFAVTVLAVHQEANAAVTALDVTGALALALGALEGLAYGRERTAPVPAARGTRRAVLVAFGVAVAALAALVGPYRLLAPERRLSLAELPRRALEGHARVATLPLLAPGSVPETAALLEDGQPLPGGQDSREAIAALGSGRFTTGGLAPREIVWSSSDGSDPLTSGRRYELLYRPDPHRSVVAELLFLVAALLLLAAFATGAIDLGRPSSPRERLVVLALVGLALLASLPGRWDQLVVADDSDSYTQHFAMRPPLYPAFLDLRDARPGEPRAHEPGDPDQLHRAPEHRFIGAVRAQKVLTIGAILVLLSVLAATWNAWLLAALAWVAIQTDLEATFDAGAAFGVSSLLSEGLCFPLVLLLVAAVIASARRPAWPLELAAAALVGLLVLARPSSAAFASVLVWLVLARVLAGESVRRALGRGALLALVVALAILAGCAWVQSRSGVFRLHAATGMHVFGAAFEVATPDDEAAFEDPAIRRFLHACLVERAADRIDYRDPGREGGLDGRYINQNIYAIGLPEVTKALALSPEEEPRRDWIVDDCLDRVGRRLIARHPLAFARLVATQALFAFDPWRHLPLALACVVAAAQLRRRRSSAALAFLFLATLPLVAILPSCAFNIPLARYRAPLAWAELAALPLFVALWLGERREPSGQAPITALAQRLRAP